MKLIDKEKVIEEIEKRIKGLKDCHADTVEGYAGEISGLKRLLSFLDTLEVKDVDLENYIHGTIDYPIIGSDFPNIYPNYKELKNYCNRKSIKDGDRVRLIIIKEK